MIDTTLRNSIAIVTKYSKSANAFFHKTIICYSMNKLNKINLFIFQSYHTSMLSSYILNFKVLKFDYGM